MKVILLEELKSQGGEGDVVDVATGYAVNFLLPRKLAIPATPGNLKQLEQRKHNIAKREAQRLDTADKVLVALEDQTVRIGAKVGEEGQLFGSVTTAQIAEAIKARFGAEIDRKRIDAHGAIKTAGEHSVTISIYRDVKANMIVEVVDEKLLKAEAAAEIEVEAVVVAEAISEDVQARLEEAAKAEAEAIVEAEAVAEAELEAIAEVVTEAEAEAEAIVEDVQARLEEAADSLVAAADAAQDAAEAVDAAALADAAVEVLRDIEEAVDAAIVDTEDEER
jgi:large subunit ribosomal protein L9